MFDFFKAEREKKKETTSLNLKASEQPPAQPVSSPVAVREAMQQMQTAYRESGIKEEIERRTKELLASGQ